MGETGIQDAPEPENGKGRYCARCPDAVFRACISARTKLAPFDLAADDVAEAVFAVYTRMKDDSH